MENNMNSKNDLWNKIDRDTNKYKMFLTMSMTFWVVTLAVLGYIGYIYYLEYEVVLNNFKIGLTNNSAIYSAKQDMLSILLSMTFIISVLATIVAFMRQRSASLQEIQLRLTMLEQSISADDTK